MINLDEPSLFGQARSWFILNRGGDAVVLLLGVRDARRLDGLLLEMVQRLPAQSILHRQPGHKLMPEDGVCRIAAGGDAGVTEQPPDVHRLYHERLGCRVIRIQAPASTNNCLSRTPARGEADRPGLSR